MRGLERWPERTSAEEMWFARVEHPDGSTSIMAKADYDAQGITPPFWSLHKQRRSYSGVVAAGMKRVCSDFNMLVAPAGFKKSGSRRWIRNANNRTDEISIERSGSSYGAPGSASIDLYVWLKVRNGDNDVALRCELVRRPNGYAYHHRFNAETWSTYERCIDELGLFVTEFADQWFKSPKSLDPKLYNKSGLIERQPNLVE